MGKGTCNAHAAHDDGSPEERVLAAGIPEHVALCVQTAEQTEQRIQRQRTDGGTKAAAQVSCHVDGAAVGIPVGGKAAHGVVGNGGEGVEQLEQEIDGDAQAEFHGVSYIEAGEHQHGADSPGNGAPQGEGTAHFAVLEPVVHSPVANQRVIDGIPQDTDGGDDTCMGDLKTHDIGQEE